MKKQVLQTRLSADEKRRYEAAANRKGLTMAAWMRRNLDAAASADAASQPLSAWFYERMSEDSWQFGLLLDTGITLAITHIQNISHAADGSLWLDVEMMSSHPTQYADESVWISPTSRTVASVAVSHIVAAFELADT